jgi:large subunit ribosomal protein L25
MHGVIRIADLPHSGKVKFLGDEDATVAHVTIIKEEAAAEPVEGAAEPEVAKKGKTDTAEAPAKK